MFCVVAVWLLRVDGVCDVCCFVSRCCLVLLCLMYYASLFCYGMFMLWFVCCNQLCCFCVVVLRFVFVMCVGLLLCCVPLRSVHVVKF